MDTNKSRVVGKTLKALRRKNGLTQVQVAERLNKPQSYVSKLETGERGLYLYEVITFAHALGETPHAIIDVVEAALRDSG